MRAEGATGDGLVRNEAGYGEFNRLENDEFAKANQGGKPEQVVRTARDGEFEHELCSQGKETPLYFPIVKSATDHEEAGYRMFRLKPRECEGCDGVDLPVWRVELYGVLKAQQGPEARPNKRARVS